MDSYSGTRRRNKGNLKPTQANENYEKDGKHTFIEGIAPYGFLHAVGFLVLLLALVYAVSSSDNFLPKSKPIDYDAKSFSGERGRKYLNGLTRFGARTAGSYECDVLAVNFIAQELAQIKKKAKKGFHIDIDIQRGSGSFAFIRKSRFIDYGFTSTYDNATNVLFKISSNPQEDSFVLINAHFDTVMRTEGASDDAVSCAILLEAVRAMSQSDPKSLRHGIIILFNGAEEGGLAGSHAFISRHPWVSKVKAVINVEAAGSGGREFVFQTGPEHPWLIHTYASYAKYPSASVVAQEVFQSGIIPSDTDFRVFVQYGNLVGIDLAFISNGYVYHTRYDDAKSIPSGSIQRAGDNIYNVAVAMANSPYLKDPSAYKHGSSVFFDVLGIFVIHYPKRLHILMNYITVAVILFYILKKLLQQYSSNGGQLMSDTSFTIPSLVFAVLLILLSWICAITLPLMLAHLLTKLNVLMTWYSYPLFGILLYSFPALLAMLLCHFLAHKSLVKVSGSSLGPLIYAHLVIFSAILLIFNYFELLSSFMLWLWAVSVFAFLCIGADTIPFLPEKKNLGLYLLHFLAYVIPFLNSYYHLHILCKFFIPLLGRAGTQLSGEYIVAVISGIGVIVAFSLITNVYHRMENMGKYIVFVLIGSVMLALYASSGRIKPYSVTNPISPKRFFMVHTLRTFHDSDGSIKKQDSGIFLNPLDYLGMKPLKNIPFYKDAEQFECDGPYCGVPYYYALRKITKHQWYLRGERPEWNHQPLSTNIYSRREVSSDIVRFTFSIKGPDHINLFLTVKSGAHLHNWSLYKSDDGYIYPISAVEGELTYFVFYTHGYGYEENWNFWIEFKHSENSNVDLAELGVIRHYLHGKDSRTRFLRKALDALPPWVCDTAWTANYDMFHLR